MWSLKGLTPVHELLSGLSSVRVVPGRRHRDSAFSERLSPAPLADSLWRWYGCVFSCPCCSLPRPCPTEKPTLSLAVGGSSLLNPLHWGSCHPSLQDHYFGATQNLSALCCLYLWTENISVMCIAWIHKIMKVMWGKQFSNLSNIFTHCWLFLSKLLTVNLYYKGKSLWSYLRLRAQLRYFMLIKPNIFSVKN